MGSKMTRLFLKLGGDGNGTVATMFALSLTFILGIAGLALEVGLWYRNIRAMQNAADSAVVAAALNNSSSYQAEAKAVAAHYGFQDGTNGTSVTVLNNQACPGGQSTCYSVAIQQPAPQFLSELVGAVAPTLNGAALANSGRQYCLLALASSGTDPAILCNGCPKADLGCDMMSDTGSTCHGHDLNAPHGDAHGTDNGCGTVERSNVRAVSDPYADLATNIPANTCSSYPQEPAKKKDPALPASNLWSGAKTLPATTIVCGDLQLSGNVTLNTASPGSVLVIENGQLDSNGYTLQTGVGAGLTIIFSGTSGSYTHAPTGSVTFDIAAPTSGVWSGVAVYHAPSLTTGVDISAAGNSPTWDITGLVYLPHSSVTFSGAVNKSSNGASCFALVVDNITVNGTGYTLNRQDCASAGLSMPSQPTLIVQ